MSDIGPINIWQTCVATCVSDAPWRCKQCIYCN